MDTHDGNKLYSTYAYFSDTMVGVPTIYFNLRHTVNVICNIHVLIELMVHAVRGHLIHFGRQMKRNNYNSNTW